MTLVDYPKAKGPQPLFPCTGRAMEKKATLSFFGRLDTYRSQPRHVDSSCSDEITHCEAS